MGAQSAVEIGEHGHCLWINADDLLVEDLHLTLSGSHGVGGSGERRNVTVRNCQIDWLGGSIIEGWKFGTVRFGNAIEIWGGCNGFRALNNRISNVYDTGVTIQCNDRKDFVCRIENVLFASTLIPDFLTGQWQTDPLSAAAARGAARSELFRASPDRTPRGE